MHRSHPSSPSKRPVPPVTGRHGDPGSSVPDCLMWNHVGTAIYNLLSKSVENKAGTAAITGKLLPGHREKVMDAQVSASAGCPGSRHTRARLNGANEVSFAVGKSPPDGNGHFPGKVAMPGRYFFPPKPQRLRRGVARSVQGSYEGAG